MGNNLIIRVIYEGVTYDLETLEEFPLRLDISAIENQELGSFFGIGSQTFELPGTKKNNKFFNHAYEVGSENIPAFYNTIDCYIIYRGETLLKGQFQLLEVIKDERRYVSYSCTISDETVQFKDNIASKLIKNADWSEYDHTLDTQNVLDSWDNNLLSGSIFYPLVEYGLENAENSGDLPLMAFTETNPPVGNFINNPFTPIQLSQLLPAIKVKDTLETVAAQAGFSITGSFFEKENLDKLYILPKGQEGNGIVGSEGTQCIVSVFSSLNQSISEGTTNYVVGYDGTALNDPCGTWNGQYISLNQIGEYNLKTQISFFNPVWLSNAEVKVEIIIMVGTFPSSGTVIASQERSLTSADGFNSFTLTAQGNFNNTNVSNQVWTWVTYTNLSPSSVPNLYMQFPSQYVLSAPININGSTVDMGLQWPSELKSIDVLKGLQQQFNLVIEPDYTRDKTLIVTQFDDWVRSGTTKDWTDKWNTAERISINHTIDEEPRELLLKNADDSDRFSKEALDQEPNYQYGTLRLLADNNISQGEKKVGDVFGPVILGGAFESGSVDVDGNLTYNIDTVLYNFAIPHLYKFDGKGIKTFKFKPRLGYKVDETVPTGKTIYVGEPNSPTAIDTSFATISNVSDLPALPTSTDLHFNNSYSVFTNPNLNLNNGINNFNSYWKTYIDSLYWEGSRKVTLDILFTAQDYRDIRLNDKIFIKDQQYRINKISGLNLNSDDIATVELIRLYPSYYSFLEDCNFDYTVENLNCDFTFEAAPWVGPTPTPEATATPTPTPTQAGPTPTPTFTPVPTATATSTPTPTPSPTPLGPTPTATLVPTPTPTGTSVPTPTPTPTTQVFAYEGLASEENYFQACNSGSLVDVYTNGPITTGSTVYSNPELTDIFDFYEYFVDNGTGVGYEFPNGNFSGLVTDVNPDPCDVTVFNIFRDYNEFEACSKCVSAIKYADGNVSLTNGLILYNDIELQNQWINGEGAQFIESGSNGQLYNYIYQSGVSASGTDICYDVIPFVGNYQQFGDEPTPAALCGSTNRVNYWSKGPVQVGDYIYDNSCVSNEAIGRKWILNNTTNDLYYVPSSGQVLEITASYICPTPTPTPTPTPATIVTQFNAGWSFTDLPTACTSPAGTGILYLAEIWGTPFDNNGYTKYLYEDAALTTPFTFYTHVVDTDTNTGYNTIDPNSDGRVPESGVVPLACPTPTPTPTATETFVAFDAAFTNQTSSLCNETNQGFTRGTYGPAAVGKTVYHSDGGTVFTGWNYLRNETTGQVWYFASKVNGIITSLYDTVVCPTPTPTPTIVVPTPTPTPTGVFETQLWAYTNNTGSLCNEINDDLVRGTYGAPAVGKIIYLENGTTPVTGQVGPYFREQANGNVWQIAQNSGTIIAFVQTVVCPTPTPTPTAVGPTPTPTSTPTPTPTPTLDSQWRILEGELCTQTSSKQRYNWNGDLNNFPAALMYDGNTGWCMDMYYISDGYDGAYPDINCDDFQFYNTCSDCQSFSNEQPCP